MLTTLYTNTLVKVAAVELAVAMPLSWLPLISDYTREAEKPFAAPKVIISSLTAIGMTKSVLKKITLKSTSDNTKSVDLYRTDQSWKVKSRSQLPRSICRYVTGRLLRVHHHRS